MSKLAILALAGAGFYAWQQGWLDGVAGAALAGQGEGQQASAAAPQGGALEALNPIRISEYEALLVKHDMELQPWSRANRKWVAAMIRTESGGLGPTALSDKGAAGLLQVMPGTAKDVYDMGYSRYLPTQSVLMTEAGGIYYGSAYLQYLAEFNRDRDWITRAYYGGPGWEKEGPNYRAQTAAYLRKVRRNYQLNEGRAA